MNKEKQIEEMADIIFKSSPIPSVWRSDAVKFAEALYAKGYRKTSDVASSVIGEILFYLDTHKQFDGFEFGKFLAELEKKYTEGER